METIKKCFEFPGLFGWMEVVFFFVAAYFLYRIVLYILKRLAKREGIWGHLKTAVRYPILLLFLELAAMGGLALFIFSEKNLKVAEHAVNIFIIGTLGWLIASILRAYFLNYTAKIGDREKAGVEERSLFTQILFLYRIGMFAVCIITVAAILLSFPYIKNIGIGILGSAGIAGIALGIAARPILLNLIAGFQIAATKTIKIGDCIFLEGESARIESIHLTHVIARTWDLRRTIFPISYFIDKPFQNWDTKDPEMQGILYLFCDYSVPVDLLRKKVEELLPLTPHWNTKSWGLHVTNCTEKTLEIRIYASAKDANAAFELKTFLMEKLVDFIQREYPQVLPCFRNIEQKI
jgi:small-conductance mechanosensitive channel